VELDLSGCECVGAERLLQELAAFHAAGSCPGAQPRSVGVACADGALIARSDRTHPCPDITCPERNPLHVVGEHVERHLGRYVRYPPPLAGPSPPLLPDLPSPSLPAQGGEGARERCSIMVSVNSTDDDAACASSVPRWPFATLGSPIYPRQPYLRKGAKGARERCSTIVSVN